MFKPSRNSNPNTLNFLEQNPSLYQSLLIDCNEELDRVATYIESAVSAPKRSGLTPYYVQAVTVGRTAFLTTNLHNADEVLLTEMTASWLIGRSANCAISIPNPAISRCHAVIGQWGNGGFYITDVGSSNGTFVNRRPLAPLERRILRDGDLIGLSTLQFELFIVGCYDGAKALEEVTYS